MPGLNGRLHDVNLGPWASVAQRLLSIPAQLASAKCMRPEQVDKAWGFVVSDSLVNINR